MINPEDLNHLTFLFRQSQEKLLLTI